MNARTFSTAVMARRAEPADSLDFFPTPPWATRALCEHALPQVWPWPDAFRGQAFDPCCGEGHMALALADYFDSVNGADVFPYGFGAVQDFLHPDLGDEQDWFVMNPPFNRAAEFIEKALRLARRGVAVVARTAFLEGQTRHAEIFARRPPQWIFQFAERAPMHRGRWVINGKSATSYAWLVWLATPSGEDRRAGTRFRWLPPGCRTALTRPDDWLRFMGCCDLPEDHPLRDLLAEKDRLKAEAARLAKKKREEEAGDRGAPGAGDDRGYPPRNGEVAVTGLVLSLFPGIGLLDMAFEEAGFCVVRGPDLLWGGDIRRFAPPGGVFSGVIGGPPCKRFSTLSNIVRARWGEEALAPDLIPDFQRCVASARPVWFLMENVERAPLPIVDGYQVRDLMLNNRWLGEEQNRLRRFSFGSPAGLTLQVALAGEEHPHFEPTVTGNNGGRRAKIVFDANGRSRGKQGNSDWHRLQRRPLGRMCELQGLAADHLANAPFTRQSAREAIANGVPLPMGRAIARAIISAIGREPDRASAGVGRPGGGAASDSERGAP